MFRATGPEAQGLKHETKWEFPKIGGALFGGPYNKDPTI